MEILAPAGSKEAFIAGINAGANSIYLGLQDFNARKNANNFNFYDLEVLTDYAHSKNIKVYVTLNILIKHQEVNDVVKILTKITPLGVDAVIVQDLGLARIIHDYFPQLRLHASTQLACHNTSGVKVLSDLGFKRIVLARELTFSEVKSIGKVARSKNIEVEIFVHGALCFSVSGMCWFSSLIGGFSGNRGLCTQPCRRKWSATNTEKGYLFSPKDLELVDYLEKIKKTGVTSLKIEGRMRSSEYVFNAVSQYKNGVLEQDYARLKSSCVFSGRDDKLFEPDQAQCMGVKISEFPDFSGAKLGDRLRIVNTETDRAFVFKYKGDIPEVEGFTKGNPVYLTGSFAFDEALLTKKVNEIYRIHTKRNIASLPFINSYTSLIARVWDRELKSLSRNETIWFKIDDPKWLDILQSLSLNSMNIIFSVNQGNLWHIPSNVIVELPPFILERELNDYKKIDAATFILNNISHFDLVPAVSEKIAGTFLYTWNAYSARGLRDLGVIKFFTSWEDDILNIKRLKFTRIVNLFGKPVITRSRMLTKDQDYGTVVSDKGDITLEQRLEGSLSILIPKNPIMIFNAKPKLKELGVNDFCLDLSFIKPNQDFLSKLLENYEMNKNFDDIPLQRFNFKRGVK
ncbi:MAG: U32 family peptidase [bacterium]|nr:U32 family peptidase [bacterium]